MDTAMEKLKQQIAIKNDELSQMKKVAKFYKKMADYESPTTNLSMVQLLSDRMNHLADFNNLIQVDFNRIQPLIYSSYEGMKVMLKNTDGILGDIDKLNAKVTADSDILDIFKVNDLEKKIKNLYDKVTIGGDEFKSIKEFIASGKAKVTKEIKDISKYSIDNISAIDVNGLQSTLFQALISKTQELTSHILSTEQSLEQKSETLIDQIESLNQQKLQLEFEEEKNDFLPKPAATIVPEVGDDLKAKRTALKAAETSKNKAEEALGKAEVEVAKAENNLLKMKEYDDLTNTTQNLSKEVATCIEDLLTELTKLDKTLKKASVTGQNAKTTTLIDATKDVENILKTANGIASGNALLVDLRNIVSTQVNQNSINEGISEKEAQLKSIVEKVKGVLKSYAIDADSILKTLQKEFIASSLGTIEADRPALDVDAAEQTKAKTELTKKETERNKKRDDLKIATLAFAEAQRVFETADLYWD